LESLAARPSDGPPMGQIALGLPIREKIERRVGKIGFVGEEPTMKVRVALEAPRVPPETGASKNRAGTDGEEA